MNTRDAVAGTAFLRGQANGHSFNAVIADGEPARERMRALRDLADALPNPDAFADGARR